MPDAQGRRQQHDVTTGADNFTYRWDCLTCGDGDSGFIKESYAEADAEHHATTDHARGTS